MQKSNEIQPRSLDEHTAMDTKKRSIDMITVCRHISWLRINHPLLFRLSLLVLVTLALCILRYSIWHKIRDDGDNLSISIPTETDENITNNSNTNIGGTNTSSTFRSEKENLSTTTVSPAALEAILKSQDVINFLNGSLLNTVYEAGFEVSNKEICPESGAFLKFLILVSTARDNAQKRMAIRKTWGFYAQRNDIAIGFVTGQSKEPKKNSDIIAESELYGDIILNKNIDAYSNLTLKITSMLEWASTYCSKVKFVVKVNDDVFLNVPIVIDLVASNQDKKRTIFGQIFSNMSVVRDPKHKNSVPHEVYPLPAFPDFAIGKGYILTGDFIKDLYVRILNTPIISNDEDVYLTGFVLQSLNGSRIKIEAVWNRDEKRCDLRKTVWVITHNTHELFDLWKRLSSDSSECI